jgi:hypothetical protein
VRLLFIAVVGSLLAAGCGSGGDDATLTCASATNLPSLVACVRDQMPPRESGGYVVPTATQRADWRAIVTQMLQGSCAFPLPVSLNGLVQVRSFTDADNGRTYCLFMEVRDQDADGRVDNGFGTFIVYGGASRQLSHQAVHPIADSTTEIQAVTVFKDTDSRSFLMAGAHRDANARASTCRTDSPESDASHNSDTMVQATNEALLAYYATAPAFVIQWHGMAVATCPDTDVYPTHGSDAAYAPDDKIATLRNNLRALHDSWDVDLPGSNSCGLNATENVQGRLWNGVAAESVCGTAASSYSQRFIHIEQDPGFRNPADWTRVIIATFP